MLVWALGLPAADLLIGPVPALPLTAARMVMAALCLLPLWWWIEGTQALRAAHWGKGVLVGGDNDVKALISAASHPADRRFALGVWCGCFPDITLPEAKAFR